MTLEKWRGGVAHVVAQTMGTLNLSGSFSISKKKIKHYQGTVEGVGGRTNWTLWSGFGGAGGAEKFDDCGKTKKSNLHEKKGIKIGSKMGDS